jgi:predicted Rossmann-fold nucleotide-binding protein
MRAETGRVVEVETLGEFDRLVHGGAVSMQGWRLQGVDLRARSYLLNKLEASGSLFLGCRIEPPTEDNLRARGALVFPTVPDVPFDAYRGSLYTARELYQGIEHGYAATPDARIYAWSRQARADVAHLLAQALHDSAIDDALTDLVEGRRLVGIMGGHALARNSDEYRAAARLGRALTRGDLLVATGGGPGAMEAANLGAYVSSFEDHVLGDAIAMLSAAPSYRPTVDGWVRVAFAVRDSWPAGSLSLGIPTWFYGHEPPNPFAGQIAKYFKNAIREDILLRVCGAGIVFLPGVAGTVQEIFQDACENYYADAATVAPMVLVGRDYWTTAMPAWPLLEALSRDRAMARTIHLVDHVSEVPALLV